MTHNIYIVEDHPTMRETINDFLDGEADLRVCGMAATGEEALERLPGLEPELVLIDTSLPGISGIALVSVLVERWPSLRCLMYSGHGETTYVEHALAAGARGYVLKGTPDELPKAIRRVIGGEVYVSESLRARSNDVSRAVARPP